MAKRLDDESRELLAYRPDIKFIEPEVMPGEIEPIEVPVQLEEIEIERQKVRQLAKAVNVLATAIQARADERAKGMVIELDPKVDAQAVAAMRRKFPDDDPTKITFEQYRSCKEDMRKRGEEIGKQASISPEQVDRATEPDATNVRPELDKNSQIIEPLDIPKFQDIMICILVNYIWKKFIKPTIPIPEGFPGLPDELCKVPKDMVGMITGMGVSILGE